MKIAVLVYEYPPKIVGGLGTYAAEITRKFVLLGHDVTVFTMNDDQGSLPTRELFRGIEIHRPVHIDVSDSLPDVLAEDVKKWGRGVRFFSKILMYNYLSAAKLINELVREEDFKFDLVVAHDWLSTIAGITIKKELGIPLAFHVHSNEHGRTLGNGSGVVGDSVIKVTYTTTTTTGATTTVTTEGGGAIPVEGGAAIAAPGAAAGVAEEGEVLGEEKKAKKGEEVLGVEEMEEEKVKEGKGILASIRNFFAGIIEWFRSLILSIISFICPSCVNQPQK